MPSDDEMIEAALKIARNRAEPTEVQRQRTPDRVEPTYYRKELEKEGRSEWSGGWASGRSR